MSRIIEECEIAIIGGGVIGLFVAYYLTKKGIDTVVIEKEDLCSGATGANDACLMAQSKKPGAKLDLAVESARQYQALADEINYDFEYSRKGSMIIFESEEDIETLRPFTKSQADAGLPVRFLDRKETFEIQPALSRHILASSYCSLDAEVNPFALLEGLSLAVLRQGGRLLRHKEVIGFEKDSDGMLSEIKMRDSALRAKTVVIAAGAHSRDVAALAGVDIPIYPRRGQILISEAISPLIGAYVMSAKAIASKHRAVSVKNAVQQQDGGKSKDSVQFGLGMIISQTVNGNMVLGVTHEFVGFDKGTTLKGLASVAKYTSTVIPALAQVNIIRSFGGLRPYSETGEYIIGPCDEVPNLILVTGHEGDGVAVAPACCLNVAQKIACGDWGRLFEAKNEYRSSAVPKRDIPIRVAD